MRSKLLGALLAVPLMIAAATSAQANIIALVIDSSTSIDNTEYATQKNGYINALTSLLPTDGSNAIAVYQFTNTVTQVFGMTLMDAAGKTALLSALNGMTRLTGTTAIGDAVSQGMAGINAYKTAHSLVCALATCIIDVSTDGMSNTGSNPATATATANAAGIQVNCLGIGAGADCSWNGAGLDFSAADFNEFQNAIAAKLSIELSNPIPEPLTLTLFGTGLLGVGFMRRRMKKV